MLQTASKRTLLVGEVVAALTGHEGEEHASLTEQMHRAASEFDHRTASSFCKALLEHLSDQPVSLRELEALIILGLAHPKVLQKARIPLAQEGRRLAALLEHEGERDRSLALLEVLNGRMPNDRHIERDLAAMMRKTGNAAKLVDRYLGRAEEAVQMGSPMDAIPWLQEVLLVDRSRRDVARMIRDLRYQEAERVNRRRRIFVRTLSTLVSLAALGGLGWREWSLREQFLAIPPADPTSIESLNQRLLAIDEMTAQNPLWVAALPASRERVRLRTQVAVVRAGLEEEARARVDALEREAAAADSARVRGRLAVEREDFATALDEFRTALAHAAPDWEHRERLERDVEALSQLISEEQP